MIATSLLSEQYTMQPQADALNFFAREDDFKALADAAYSPLHTVTSYNHIGDDVYKTTEMWFCYKDHIFTMIREEKYNG